MLRDDHPLPHPPSHRRRRPGRSKRVLAALTATLAATAIISGGVLVKESRSHSAQASVALEAAAKETAAKAVVPSGWKETFASNFSGTKLNTKVWATCYAWSTNGSGCTNFGNNNEEKEWYLPSQVKVSGGDLHLVAQRAVTKGRNAKSKPETYLCRSGMVTTNPGFNFEYGYVQVIARLPYSAGLWEAIWLAATNGKWPPEVDVLEHWASVQQAKVYLHPSSGARQGGPVYTPGNLSKGWHSFTLVWTKSKLTWYIDSRQVFSTTKGVPQQKMYLIMNVADTSTAVGACTGSMDIKSVKVWQP
jgi:beta-glucanase (GH16 family)